MSWDIIKARHFVEATLYEVPRGPAEARCIDGRHETRRALAFPGADAGYFFAAVGALRTLGAAFVPQDVWDAIVEVVEGEENFRYHSDTYTQCPYSGCGHVVSVVAAPAAYDVKPEDAVFLCRQLKLLDAKGYRPDRLHGDHSERALIIVNSTSCSLFTQAAGERAFIFHRTFNASRLEMIAVSLRRKIREHNPAIPKAQLIAALKRQCEKHLELTLRGVAFGIPWFEVYAVSRNIFDIRAAAPMASAAVS